MLFDGDYNGFWFDIDTCQGDLGRLGLGGGLIFGAQPADVSIPFFGGAFGVEGDEAFEDGFGDFGGGFARQVLPAIGFKYGFVEFVVDLVEGGDEGAVVVCSIDIAKWCTSTQFFEQVIHSGDGDIGMGGLNLFAMSV